MAMEFSRQYSDLSDRFDPISVLVEDAISFDPQELLNGFIDRLVTSPPQPLGTCRLQLQAHGRQGDTAGRSTR